MWEKLIDPKKLGKKIVCSLSYFKHKQRSLRYSDVNNLNRDPTLSTERRRTMKALFFVRYFRLIFLAVTAALPPMVGSIYSSTSSLAVVKVRNDEKLFSRLFEDKKRVILNYGVGRQLW